MNVKFPISFSFLFLLISCSISLNFAEINNLEKVGFEPLIIKPDFELYDLRIDILRQTYEEDLNDSIAETKAVPYHVLGFNAATF